ncbi:hypothetical protein HU200_044772 [Digitaria exilis]|uniref:Methyltransferase type 11 domain-containing protein n=1 Tax=Digitaria exilis TaxID=1010633 RepID=A0A835B1L5_9POAL|nr:hypothetical protein HU200_044772 [Digitaria exilis]
MRPAGRVSFTRAALLLGAVALVLWLLTAELAAVSGGGSGADPAFRAAVGGRRRTHAEAAVRSPDAWRTREWRQAVDHNAAILRRHLADGMLAASSVAVCLGGDGVQEAMALRELGVVGAVAVAKEGSPPLAVAGTDRRLPFPDDSVDFVFAGRALDESKHLADIASEAARVVKPDGHGHLVVLTSGASDAYSLRSLQALLPSLRLLRSREINGHDGSTLRELVFRKHADISATSRPSSNGNNSVGDCPNRDHKLEIIGIAEPLIQEEPAKPWITLKRNIKYLPALADIGFKRRYVYIDVGARGYGSSIGGWFRKQYPKQNHTFEVFAVEADPAFHGEYATKKGVTLLPYAAWVRNETLTFEINDGPGKNGETRTKRGNGRGMGRIRHAAGAAKGVSSGEVRRVPAFDLAAWLKRTVSEQDYVVMKMDVEGTEFDLIPRMIDTGAICLVDELFLECHYNRWQRCCPGERSPKYSNTYGQCLELFTSLRNSGVLVHQWW